ncbi:hypothetical protein PVAP13_8KG229400 [Panicum virgatum]|uniref:Uncharacterized protein n=1 Tax=Panicum virgatum TaxID=38727 RepID=A0A8T0PMN8_PANVG|nr:hypothetical protein PVAP13_8KG229400 [Panicum virgatum]
MRWNCCEIWSPPRSTNAGACGRAAASSRRRDCSVAALAAARPIPSKVARDKGPSKVSASVIPDIVEVEIMMSSVITPEDEGHWLWRNDILGNVHWIQPVASKYYVAEDEEGPVEKKARGIAGQFAAEVHAGHQSCRTT